MYTWILEAFPEDVANMMWCMSRHLWYWKTCRLEIVKFFCIIQGSCHQVECDIKPGLVFKLPTIVKWKANFKKHKSPKRKPDTLWIDCRNSTQNSKSQKNANPWKENWSPINLPTMIGNTIFKAQGPKSRFLEDIHKIRSNIFMTRYNLICV